MGRLDFKNLTFLIPINNCPFFSIIILCMHTHLLLKSNFYMTEQFFMATGQNHACLEIMAG